MEEKPDLPLIGRKELISLPDLGIYDIEARIDTGAYTSSLHCSEIAVKKNSKGEKVLAFKMLDRFESEHTTGEFEFKDFSEAIVKSSNGIAEKRYKIMTTLVLGGHEINTSITLANRSEMRYPALIGRKALKNRFLVDVSSIYLLKKK